MATPSPARRPEPILDPDIPIIDPHHHLWDLRGALARRGPKRDHPFDDILPQTPLYLLDALNADLASGHRVVATVFMECGAFYRADGPDRLKPVGETEFVRGIAAQSASGLYGPTRACAAIVGHVDMGLGDAAAEVLDAHIEAGGGRFRGVRHMLAHDPDPSVLGMLGHTPAGFGASAAFRAALGHFAARGLSFDIWALAPQLDEVVALVRAFPDTAFILDHLATPVGIGRHAGTRDAGYAAWKAGIRALAELPNIAVKVGGLAMPFADFPGMPGPAVRPSSETLAAIWRPYVETAIEAFGAERAMFESNFPVDRWGADYPTLWNAFKRIVGGASAEEKAQLFAGTAARVYRLDGLIPS